MSTTDMTDLPKHTPDLPAARKSSGRLRATWLWALLVVLGAALVLAPIRLGMYGEAAEGQRMVERFAPVLTDQRLDRLDRHLRVIEAARAESAARRLPHDDLSHQNTVEFVAAFPEANRRFSQWIATMRADEGVFGQLQSLPPFGAFPFVFGLAGLALLVLGALGLLAGSARAALTLRALVALVGALLVVFPAAAGLFDNASSGTRLLADFRPILTEANVRWAQSEFVVIGPASAELLGDLHTNSQADLPATKAFVDQWATISSDFASFIEEFADNLGHFQALERLNQTTRPLGFAAFDAFGWFYLLPGVLLILASAADALLRGRSSAPEPGFPHPHVPAQQREEQR